jgi:hypothetical protein
VIESLAAALAACCAREPHRHGAAIDDDGVAR